MWGGTIANKTKEAKTYMFKPIISKPIPALVNVSDCDDAEYIELAQSIGLESPAFRLHQLTKLLAEKNIPIYNYEQVVRFLGDKISSGYMVWAPLRKQDIDANCVQKLYVNDAHGYILGKHQQFDFDIGYNLPYNKAVPISVLQTVKTINDNFPDARFFVSELAHLNVPDPFLAVGFDGTELLVVDFWDEPGFKPIG